jgi:hypothetical protein
MDKPLATSEPLALIGFMATKGLVEEQFNGGPRVTDDRQPRRRRVRRWTAYRVRAVADWLEPAAAPCP